MRILDLYVMRSIAGPTLLVAFTLMAISSIMALVGELESAERLGYGLGIAIQFVLLSLPAGVYQLAPTTILLGTLLGLGALASGSELVVMRASGMSLLRLAMATSMGGLIFAVLMFAVGDWLVPLANQMSYDLRTESRYEGQRRQDGVWFREGNRFIHIESIYGQNRLGRVHEYAFDDRRRITNSMLAQAATYQDNAWLLAGVRQSLMQDERIRVKKNDEQLWDVRIDPDLLSLSALRADFLSARGLWEYARYLNTNGLDAYEYWIALWRKLAMPVTIIVMSLVAIPFVVGSLRSTGQGQRLFIGIILGIGFFLLNEIIGNSGQVYGLQPWATAMLPTLLVATVAFIWMERVR